jgi:hypothetical protein
MDGRGVEIDGGLYKYDFGYMRNQIFLFLTPRVCERCGWSVKSSSAIHFPDHFP